jgi:hypothetical protein
VVKGFWENGWAQKIVSLSILMFAAVVISCMMAHAEPIRSQLGIHDSLWNSYYNEIFVSTFSSSYNLQLITDNGGMIYCPSNGLEINTDFGIEESGSDYPLAYVETDELGIDTRPYNKNLGCFYISVDFTPLSNDYDDHFWIFKSNEVGLFLSENLNLGVALLYEWEDGSTQFILLSPTITTLIKDQSYSYVVWITYDSILEKRIIEIWDWDVLLYQNSYTHHNIASRLTTLVIGDDTSEADNGRGRMRWSSIGLYGHSSCRFYDNFNDLNAGNWRTDVYHTDRNNQHGYWDVNCYGELFIKSVGRDPNPGGGWDRRYIMATSIKSPFIDYDPDDSYTISLDFKVTNADDEFVLASNNEIVVLFEAGELLTVWDNDWNIKDPFYDVEVNTWYHMKIEKIYLGENGGGLEQYYTIWINGIQIDIWDEELMFFDIGNGVPWLEVGDFFSDDQWTHGAYWDNIRLFSLSEISSTGFGTSFMDNDLLIFLEDFESTIDLEEYGWALHEAPFESDPYVVGEDTGEHWILNEPGLRYSSNNVVAIGGDLGVVYESDLDTRMNTPPIDLSHLSDATLSFWMSMETEEGVDGWRLEYRIPDPDGRWPKDYSDPDHPLWKWEPFGVGKGFYNMNPVSEFSGEAFSGTLLYWTKYSLSLTEICGVGFSKVEFSFHFKSNDNIEFRGVCIDDIRIDGKNNNLFEDDYDDDILTNSIEYYLFGSSIYCPDTDYDGLSDYVEVHDNELNKLTPAPYHPPPANPCKRDVFVEIDSMVDSSGVSYITQNIKNYIELMIDSFDNHDIEIHLIYDQANNVVFVPRLDYGSSPPVPYDANLDGKYNSQELQNIALDYFNTNHRETHHYLLITDYVSYDGDDAYGIDWKDNAYALAVQKIKDDFNKPGATTSYERKTAQSFQHEAGHAFGLRHYPHQGYMWEPHYPGNTAMSYGMDFMDNVEFKYIEEDSDLRFWSSDLNQWRYRGGWEYSYKPIETWQPGLYLYVIGDWN